MHTHCLAPGVFNRRDRVGEELLALFPGSPHLNNFNVHVLEQKSLGTRLKNYLTLAQIHSCILAVSVGEGKNALSSNQSSNFTSVQKVIITCHDVIILSCNWLVLYNQTSTHTDTCIHMI